VREQFKRDPHSGQLFVFRRRRGGLIKILWHDGQGMCLFAKRLERGRFIWPSASAGAVTITAAQLGYLLEGIDSLMPQHTGCRLRRPAVLTGRTHSCRLRARSKVLHAPNGGWRYRYVATDFQAATPAVRCPGYNVLC
jgi:transposase